MTRKPPTSNDVTPANLRAPWSRAPRSCRTPQSVGALAVLGRVALPASADFAHKQANFAVPPQPKPWELLPVQLVTSPIRLGELEAGFPLADDSGHNGRPARQVL